MLSGTEELVGLVREGSRGAGPRRSPPQWAGGWMPIFLEFGCTQKVSVAGKTNSAGCFLLYVCVSKEELWDGNTFSVGRRSQGVAFCLAEPQLSHIPGSKKSLKRGCGRRERSEDIQRAPGG